MKRHHLHALMALGALALVAFAVVWLQQRIGLLPCPLCVLQRIAFLLFALCAGLAALQRPRALGHALYSLLLGLWALVGAAIATWQVYLTYHPQLAECGISPEERFLNSLPLARWWPALFEANGDCTRVDWTFLGLSVPELSLLAFLALLILTLLAARLPGSR